MRFWGILSLLVVCAIIYFEIPAEWIFNKEMIGPYLSFAAVCVFIHHDFFIKEIVNEVKEIIK